MDTTKPFSAALRAYELARARRAALVTLPVMAVPALSWGLSAQLQQLALGALLCVAVAVFSWRGQTLERAISTGLKAGLVPFALSHLAQLYGHRCTATLCTQLCLGACVVGGVIAGAVLIRDARRLEQGPSEMLAASTVCLLTGALSCSCIGFTGMLALTASVAGVVLFGRVLARS